MNQRTPNRGLPADAVAVAAGARATDDEIRHASSIATSGERRRVRNIEIPFLRTEVPRDCREATTTRARWANNPDPHVTVPAHSAAMHSGLAPAAPLARGGARGGHTPVCLVTTRGSET